MLHFKNYASGIEIASSFHFCNEKMELSDCLCILLAGGYPTLFEEREIDKPGEIILRFALLISLL